MGRAPWGNFVPRLSRNANMYLPPTFNAFHMRKIPGSPCLHNFNVRVPEHGSLGTRLPWGLYQIFAGTLVTKHLARNVTQNTRPIPRFGNETKTLPQSQTYVCDLGMELLLSFFTKVLGYEVDVVNSVQFSNHTGMSNRTCLSCDLSSVCANLESPSCLYSLCSMSETPQLSIRAAVLTYIAMQHIPRLPNLLVHQHGSNLLYASLCIFKKLWHHMKSTPCKLRHLLCQELGTGYNLWSG